VLGSEKKVPALLDPTTVPKIGLLTDNIGMAYSGMGPDSRVLLRKGRKVGQQYWLQYHDPIPVSGMVRELAGVMQEFTQSGGVRPFGVSLLIAGYDDLGAQLYQVDPSGSFWAWKAAAIGKNMNNARTFLEKRYTDGMELEDAIHTVILTLKDGFEGAMTEHSIEIGYIAEDRVFHLLTPEQIKEYLDILG
jgi:20S proteasome subunit alpha 2